MPSLAVRITTLRTLFAGAAHPDGQRDDDQEVSYLRDGIAFMSALYTKNGRPLQISGNELHSRSGKYLGHIEGDKVFDPQGRTPVAARA
ncbi:hypothetical protein AB0K00_52400 [Dactylosporangium sp. NPDC049525]|uniref:hypothetical protein n=1 Tax=Dactylosporangium sp. NPDC049525 TaxID=3154730 RepID=UPI003423BA05